MQAVRSMGGKAASAFSAMSSGAKASGGTGAGGASAAANPGGLSSKVMSTFGFAGSAVSALSKFAMARQQAEGLKRQEADERLGARVEMVQAQETANAIQREFNDVVGLQRASAGAMGIDVSSGSVVAARDQAQADADQQIGVVRRGAEMNAALRRARAEQLRIQAKLQKRAAGTALAMDLTEAAVSAFAGMGGGKG